MWYNINDETVEGSARGVRLMHVTPDPISIDLDHSGHQLYFDEDRRKGDILGADFVNCLPSKVCAPKGLTNSRGSGVESSYRFMLAPRDNLFLTGWADVYLVLASNPIRETDVVLGTPAPDLNVTDTVRIMKLPQSLVDNFHLYWWGQIVTSPSPFTSLVLIYLRLGREKVPLTVYGSGSQRITFNRIKVTRLLRRTDCLRVTVTTTTDPDRKLNVNIPGKVWSNYSYPSQNHAETKLRKREGRRIRRSRSQLLGP